MTDKETGSIQKQLARPGSALKKYQEATVGSKSLPYLIAYELITGITGSIPGILGKWLRNIFYPVLLKHVGSGCTIGRNCSIKRPYRVELEDNATIGNNVSLDVKMDGQGIRICSDVVIGASTIFSCIGSRITIGAGTRIGASSRLGSLQGLTVGRNCVIGNRTYIVGASHKTDLLDQPIIEQPITCKGPNTIGDNVIIGDEVTVLDGVSIGDGVIVESGSLVIRDVAAGLRVAGAPATPVARVK